MSSDKSIRKFVSMPHPMAVAILGGVVASAIVCLFVLPALYLRLASPQPKPEMPEGIGSEQHA